MTNRLAITAGPWSSQLLPELSRWLSVTNQCVGYFELVGEPNLFQVGQFPVWIYLGLGKNNTLWSSQFGHEGIKIARHETTGQTADLDSGTRSSDLAILDLRQFLNRHFQHSIQRFSVVAEYLLYTNTETEDYLIDFYPENPMWLVGRAFQDMVLSWHH